MQFSANITPDVIYCVYDLRCGRVQGDQASLGAHSTALQLVVFLIAVTICTSSVDTDLCALDMDLASIGWDSECARGSTDMCNVDGITCQSGALSVQLNDANLAGTLDEDWHKIVTMKSS